MMESIIMNYQNMIILEVQMKNFIVENFIQVFIASWMIREIIDSSVKIHMILNLIVFIWNLKKLEKDFLLK